MIYGPYREKTCLRGFTYNTGADKPVHRRSLISAFVILFLKSICNLATGEILIFQLVSVAEETGLKLPSSETPKTSYFMTRPILSSINQCQRKFISILTHKKIENMNNPSESIKNPPS